jgi:class 3 adenylate cyclase/pimeloyl-ACP methyl ester carboxylesterase
MEIPDVRYARAGRVAVAFQVVGDRPRTLLFSPPLSDLYSIWAAPFTRPFLDRLAAALRLVVFNPRGTGFSDKPRDISLEARMDDIVAVLESLDVDRVSHLGNWIGANTCALFAASYPERCERLVLQHVAPRGTASHDYPYGASEEWALEWIREVRAHYGEREFLEQWARSVDPSVTETPEALDWFVWQRRMAASPSAAAEWTRVHMETDITDVLSAIRTPTLLMHRDPDREIAAFVAQRFKDARTLEVRSVFSEEASTAILEFIKGETLPVVPDSVLATVLFTDLVGSTERAAAVGDRRWREMLEAHHRVVRRDLNRYRGVEIDTAGDGFFCRFDGPGRAIACARAIIESTRELDLEVRAGIHTGECQVIGDKIAGVAVNAGSRIADTALPGEVLVSSTVRDLVAGSNFAFEERGEHKLKGVPGYWRLYAVMGD